jgi:hypothetical protein
MVINRQAIDFWRSLGETKGAVKNPDKTGTNQLGCRVSDTTLVYHRARLNAYASSDFE